MPEEKVPYCLQDYGNTNSASIPLTMVTRCAEPLQKGAFECLACGFGVGLAWGSMKFSVDHIEYVGLSEYCKLF